MPGDSFRERNSEAFYLQDGKRLPGKLYYGKPHLVYRQSTLTVLSTHRVCVQWN